jgi:uncharacterized coiled-coil protein SlyX
LQAIDENIVQQLTVHQKLLLLRDLVVNSLNRFVRDRSCVNRQAEYQKTLELYSRQLAELSQNYDRLNRRGMQLAQDLKSTAGEQPDSKKMEEQPPLPPPPGRTESGDLAAGNGDGVLGHDGGTLPNSAVRASPVRLDR